MPSLSFSLFLSSLSLPSPGALALPALPPGHQQIEKGLEERREKEKERKREREKPAATIRFIILLGFRGNIGIIYDPS